MFAITLPNSINLTNHKEPMNQARFDILIRGLTVQARKVFDSVPNSEAWSAQQIIGDLQRRDISMRDLHVVRGCLNSLIASGLVIEGPSGLFRREKIKVKPDEITPEHIQPAVTEEPMATKTLTTTTKPEKSTVIEKFGGFAKRLRDLASDLETAALELEEESESRDAETAKLRQLPQLLKSLG